jgi:sterol 3beta-glucosyltransferase
VRFTVVTYGSEGDTRPLVALCRGLMDAGHEVQFFAEQSTVGNATAHGVPVEALAGDIKSTLPMDSPSEQLRRRDVMKAVKDGLRVINGNTASWMKAVFDHARASDAVLFAGLASPMAEAIAEGLNKPAINLYLQPTSPTREFASPILPPMQLPGWVNLLSYRASPKSMIRRLYGKSADSAREEIFGKRNSARIKRDFPILYGFSRHLVPRPGDWPATHQICGHWSLLSNDWQPPSDLLEFLSAGPPPIYVGFGAVSSFIRQKGLSEIASAIAGRRALFYPGWSKITAAMLPKNVFVLDDTPHAWLFPLTSMVIHHCGAGTTHTAARAGVPSIALPVGADQFFWAGRLASAGVAPKYIRGTKIEAKSLAKMIDFAARDDVCERAKALGAAMSEENGVANAVTAIEAQMARAFESART